MAMFKATTNANKTSNDTTGAGAVSAIPGFDLPNSASGNSVTINTGITDVTINSEISTIPGVTINNHPEDVFTLNIPSEIVASPNVEATINSIIRQGNDLNKIVICSGVTLTLPKETFMKNAAIIIIEEGGAIEFTDVEGMRIPHQKFIKLVQDHFAYGIQLFDKLKENEILRDLLQKKLEENTIKLDLASDIVNAKKAIILDELLSQKSSHNEIIDILEQQIIDWHNLIKNCETSGDNENLRCSNEHLEFSDQQGSRYLKSLNTSYEKLRQLMLDYVNAKIIGDNILVEILNIIVDQDFMDNVMEDIALSGILETNSDS